MTTTMDRIGDLMELGLERGLAAGSTLVDAIRASPLRPRLSACSCQVPAPCWMPRELPPVTSNVCTGGRATLRIRVTNCSPQTARVRLVPRGEASGEVKVDPGEVSLGPLERGVLSASLDVGDAERGAEREVLVWVRGCVDHVVRWTVRVRSRGSDSCHELDVDDCPDYVHHWYDHFYCTRPCRGGRD